MKIENIELQKILNSKNDETIQAVVKTNKATGVAASPSGVSAGKYEKIHLTETVDQTILHAKPILDKLIGYDINQQQEIDTVLMELPGAVSISTSIAVAMTAAQENNLELYQYLNADSKAEMPTLLNLICAGGQHAKGKGPEFQEFLAIQPQIDIEEQMKKNEIIHKQFAEKYSLTEMDYEKGWISPFSNTETVKKLKEFECQIGIDAAASEFFKEDTYIYKKGNKTKEEQIEYVTNMINDHQIMYFEDPLEENDFEGFSEILKNTKNCMIAGDDLTTTNLQRLQKAIDIKACNSIIIKPNQVGTLTQTKETVKLAQKNNITCVASHRAGETNDNYLSHIVLAYNIPYMKISIVGEERTCKLKELIRLKK